LHGAGGFSCPYPMLLPRMIAMPGDFCMTSEERREARYQRRRAKREAKRKALEEKYSFERVISIDSLLAAEKEARKGVRWKASVQRYHMRSLSNAYKTHMELLSGGDPRRGFYHFDICERGKARHIMSVKFYERVVQKSLCTNALYPLLTRPLLYDNGASQKGKGTHFSLRRLVVHLRRHIHRHGRDGGILLIDYKDFFGSASHEVIRDMFERLLRDERLFNLAWLFVDAFGDRGLGLGSEVSQAVAVSMTEPIDRYVKQELKIKGYARYMDDSYLIHEDIAYLEYCLEDLTKLCESYGITINRKKTHVRDLKHGFTYLKTRFFITESGHIIKKPCQDSITRERRKLKRQARLVKDGRMTLEQVSTSYQSWRGALVHRDSFYTIMSMDGLFTRLYGAKPEIARRKNYG